MRHLRFVGPIYRYAPVFLALSIIACGTVAPDEDTATTSSPAAQPTAAATPPPAPMTEPTSVPQAQPEATPEPEVVGKSGGVVPMQKHAAPRRIDPHPSGSGIDMSEATLLYNGLVKYNDIGDVKQIVGDLATHWDVSDDGLTYTFIIPEGVQWTDGTPLTAADVVFSLDRMVQEGESRPRAGALRTYYASSEAIDPQSVAVNLKFPAAAFLPALGIDYMKVVPKHVVEAGTEIGDVAPQVGSGPYEMVEYRKGDLIEYKRNENYFKDGLPLLDGIIKYVITDKGRTKAGFETKQLLMATVGFTGMNVQDYLNLQESAGDHLTVHFMNDFLAIGLMLNTTIPPYDNPKVRRALFLAVDRQAQVSAFGFGKGSIHGPLPSWLWFGMPEAELLEVPGFRQTADGKKDPQDIEMAKQLLAEAGYPDGFDATITVRQTGIYADQAALLKDQFREIGIDITTRPMESTAGIAAFLALDFEMGIQGTGFAFHDPDQILAGLYLPRGARNYPGWEHPKITELYDQQARATDQTKRGEIISEIEQILLYEDNHWVGLLWDNFGWPVSKQIQDFYVPSTVASTGMMWERIWLDQ
ncbi:MAG: ABC transporter substrate-binding protein [Dehalococcoidia bacterium]|nr:ABC transporter substrate-binding protein [Dehalococcoidia bacterium]